MKLLCSLNKEGLHEYCSLNEFCTLMERSEYEGLLNMATGTFNMLNEQEAKEYTRTVETIAKKIHDKSDFSVYAEREVDSIMTEITNDSDCVKKWFEEV